VNPLAEIIGFIRSPRPLGAGAFKRLGLTIFEATLWTDAPAWSMAEPFALSIAYNRGFGAQELVDRSLEEMRRLGNLTDAPLGVAQVAVYAAELARVFRSVRKGDRITALYRPAKNTTSGGTVFFHNGAETGVVADPALLALFFDIWLAPEASEQRLRRELLGRDAAVFSQGNQD
jgi:hypothetical protein